MQVQMPKLWKVETIEDSPKIDEELQKYLTALEESDWELASIAPMKDKVVLILAKVDMEKLKELQEKIKQQQSGIVGARMMPNIQGGPGGAIIPG